MMMTLEKLLFAILANLIAFFTSNFNSSFPSDCRSLFLKIFIFQILGMFFLWICWKLESNYKLLSFYLELNSYPFVFFGYGLFVLARGVSLFILAQRTSNTIHINSILWYILFIGNGILIAYTLYSLIFYSIILVAEGKSDFERVFDFLGKTFKGKLTNASIPLDIYIITMLMELLPCLAFKSYPAFIAGVLDYLIGWIYYFISETPNIDKIIEMRDIKVTI